MLAVSQIVLPQCDLRTAVFGYQVNRDMASAPLHTSGLS